MLLQIPGILAQAELAHCNRVMEGARWVDGNATAGHQSAQAKCNEQLAEDSEEARALGELVLQALARSALFFSAAMPKQVFPPLFNRYAPGMRFGNHVDAAIRSHPVQPVRIRADLSATLFLAEPETYDGGELLVEDTFGVHRIKLPAGDMVLYPASSLHRVEPITRGMRIASFFWLQSMVRDDAKRALLFDLDMAVIKLEPGAGNPSARISLTAVYHNLLRMWAEP